MPYTYDYPRPMLCADCIIFHKSGEQYFVLLIQRGNEPYKGMWALPGGFMEMDETIEQTAARELQEETGLSGIKLKQFYTFSKVDRDPRGRNVSVVFSGFFDGNMKDAKAGDDAQKLQWFPVNNLPGLAFDHDEVLNKAVSDLLT